MARRPLYTARAEPVEFEGRVLMGGVLVWRCDHVHSSKDEALTCAAGGKAMLDAAPWVPCIHCGEEVSYLTEHYEPSTFEWDCTFVPEERRRFATPRNVVSSIVE